VPTGGDRVPEPGPTDDPTSRTSRRHDGVGPGHLRRGTPMNRRDAAPGGAIRPALPHRTPSAAEVALTRAVQQYRRRRAPTPLTRGGVGEPSRRLGPEKVAGGD